jgi:hypothetical protein
MGKRLRNALFVDALLCLAVLFAGCNTSPDLAAPTAAVAEPTPTDAPGVASAQSEPSPPTANGTEVSPAAVADFTPPFPERTELFEPPKRAQTTVRRDDESGNTVELKGFINVGSPKAVLSIDGVITPIAAGDEKYGVQVISIDGPAVVLQRGRSRWTATLD